MTDEGIKLEFNVVGGNFSDAGEAASKIKNILKQLGIKYEIIKRVAIASYEAEMNIVAYAVNGVIKADIGTDEIAVTATDNGPGIPDIEQAMREGFSTAPPEVREMGFGAGMGLPNIKKSSDWMNLNTVLNEGTKLEFRIKLK
ncbi:MAG TPA: ATP-binding protein [bacterium]|nr:ATP-binding protein [bacterium]